MPGQLQTARRDCPIKLFRSAVLYSLCALLPSTVVAETVEQLAYLIRDCSLPFNVSNKRVVIVIDDLGHHFGRGRDAINLPGDVTLAVIPHTPHGKKLATAAHNAGKEVMLHAPMSPLDESPLGNGALTAQQSREEFVAVLHGALAEIPHVRGINNHMGSELTQRRQQMSWLMQEIREQGMYFIDSRTSKRTVAATVAAEFSVPHLSRHVFLDNERNAQAIDERFHALLRKVEKEGLAVAIGHPYPETINYLRDAIPKLQARGIELVFASQAMMKIPTSDGTSFFSSQANPARHCAYNLTSMPRLAM